MYFDVGNYIGYFLKYVETRKVKYDLMDKIEFEHDTLTIISGRTG